MLFSKDLGNEMDHTWVNLLRAVTTAYKVGKQQGFHLKYWMRKNMNKKDPFSSNIQKSCQ